MIPELLYQLLRGLVDDRAYPNQFPQPAGNAAPVWPAIRYTITSATPAASLCGTNDGSSDDVTVRIDVVAATYAGMRSLVTSVIAAIDNTDPPSTRQPGGFETYDAETKTHRALLEYTFHQSTDGA